MAEVSTSGAAGPHESIDLLLERGLTPRQVCEQFFKAIWDKDHNKWLATIHIDRRAVASSSSEGPFASLNWEMGRARVEKYMVQYRFKSEVEGGKLPSDMTAGVGSGALMTCTFEPCYGPVPGYEEWAPLGPAASLTLARQGGPNGEWRVVGGAFR